ncbi:malectin domain-containing carbohydrate-binding protein [Hyalangium minutum]|uniref:malectin domain-containing carbohydrate-binding protein n=1 Tax=Hyalangium minutum TaxID=394096 RepID=UPI000A41B1CE|nr:malectin domain-containing carbohydrate-binding protein [Hyalangium minutum]
MTLPIRINVGGGAFTDTYGRLWQADTGYQGYATAFTTTEPISGTENDGLYQSMRIGVPDILYEIPVPGPGLYTVQFLLIEPQRNLAAPRNMRIDAENWSYVDQYQGLVTPLRSYTLFFDVPVVDGALSLQISSYAGSQPPVVSAIEVTPSKWSWLGGSPLAKSTRLSSTPALAVDGANRPVFAWEQDYDINIARWTGSTYERLGGPLGDAYSLNPTIMVDASGAPVVSFTDQSPDGLSGRCVRTMRWNGAAWADVGGRVCLQNYGALSVASALNKQGQPVLAVLMVNLSLEDARVHVYQFNGTAWEQVGDAVGALGAEMKNTFLEKLRPEIAVDPSGRIVVAWSETYVRGTLAGKAFAHVFRRNNGQWVRVGTQLPSNNNSSEHPSLALAPDGTPWVAYIKDGAIAVVREQNGAWGSTSTTGLKGRSGPVDRTIAPVLRIDSAGTATVLWLEDAPYHQTGRFLRRWNGTAWAPVDNHLGSFGTHYLSGEPYSCGTTDMAVALTSTGQLIVAMPEVTPANADYGYIRLRMFAP